MSRGEEPRFDAAAVIARLRQPAKQITCDEQRAFEVPPGTTTTAIGLSPDLTRYALGDDQGNVALYDFQTGKKLHDLGEKLPEGEWATSIGFGPDNSHVLIGLTKSGGYLVDGDLSKKIRQQKIGAEHQVTEAGISTDGKWVLLATNHGELHRYPVAGGKGLTLNGEEKLKKIAGASFSPDGAAGANFFQEFFGAGGAVFPTETSEVKTATVGFEKGLHGAAIANSTDIVALYTNEHQVLVFPAGGSSEPNDDRFLTFRSPHGLDRPARGVTSGDGRFLIFFSQGPDFEIRPARAPNFARRFRFPGDNPQFVQVSPDARTFFCLLDGKLRVFQLADVPALPGEACIVGLTRLFNEEKFAELDALLELAATKEWEPFPWEPNRTPFDFFLSYLMVYNAYPVPRVPDFHAKLAAWRKACPDSQMPEVMLARRYLDLAWRIRGGGAANTVNEKQWKGFHENLEKGVQLVTPGLERKHPLPETYRLTLKLVMGENWPEEEGRTVADRIVAEMPRYLEGHAAVLQARLPRWGGEPEDCQIYATHVADELGGAAGDALYARITIDLSRYTSERTFVADNKLDYERLKRGLLELARTAPDRIWAQHRGLRLAVARKDVAAAKEFAKFLEDPIARDAWEPAWWQDKGVFAAALKYAQ